MSQAYKNKILVEPDLIIFQRPSCKKGTWQYRATIVAKGKTTYDFKSCKTADRHQAERVAKKALKKLIERRDKQQDLTNIPFDKKAIEWLSELERSEEYDARQMTARRAPIRNHLMPHFKTIDVRDIDSEKILGYLEARKTKPTKLPAAQTISKEMWVLGQFFDWLPDNVVSKHQKPALERISLKTGKTKNTKKKFRAQTRRTGFRLAQIQEIRRQLAQNSSEVLSELQYELNKKWAKLDPKGRPPILKYVSDRTPFNRSFVAARTLELYVDLVFGTGARPSTLSRLTPSDVIHTDDNGMMLRSITLKGDEIRDYEIAPTDVGADAIEGFMNLYEWRCKARGIEADPHYDETTPLIPLSAPHINRMFCRFLDSKDMREDKKTKRKFSIYSLRHTYINERLAECFPVSLVASNTMTSVQMIDRYYRDQEARRHQKKFRVKDQHQFKDADIKGMIDQFADHDDPRATTMTMLAYDKLVRTKYGDNSDGDISSLSPEELAEIDFEPDFNPDGIE